MTKEKNLDNDKKSLSPINKIDSDKSFRVKMAEHNLSFPPVDDMTPNLLNMALCFTSCKWGQGECGHQLMENLLVTFSESLVKPKYFIFMDSAIYLATQNTPVQSVDFLKKIEQSGAKVLLNHSSVTQYGQMSSIEVGEVVKFMEITDIMLSVERFTNF
ncbi:MAG: hypothetical protein COB02_14235 [Candidatus Cloacimonadota bacterium]|nr:MAG: hypothetical protein COB02_14235 [Candidatus Cloacimonadota bacterium]